jgi:ADP-heptose:LPS heptosyltransferase
MLPRRNCLILHAGALGDFVLSWPLVMALGRIHPQSRIIVVTAASKGQLAEAALRVESADIEQGWHSLFTDAGDVPESVARMLGAAHVVYSFVSSDGDVTIENLKRLAGGARDGQGAQVISLSPRPPEGYAKHASEFLLEQLGNVPAAGAAKSGVEQMLKSIAARGVGAARSDSGDVLVHPGSGGEHKCWPVARFVKLVEKLKKKKFMVRVLLGEVEMERFGADEVKQLEGVAEVARPQTYVQLFNELRHSSVVVANDSGPGHLAGIIGVKTVSIFGASDPRIWKPLGPRVKVVKGEAMEKISVEEVLAAVIA